MVKITKKTIIISLFSVLLGFMSIRLCMVVATFLQWRGTSEKIMKQNKIMMSDLRWAQWQAPPETEQYIRLWLFKQDHDAKIVSSKVVEIYNSIRLCEIELESGKCDDIVDAIKNIPFGRVSFLRNNDHMKIMWYWSEELKTNNKLPKLDNVMNVSLESIIISDRANEWKVKLNGAWIDNTSPKIDNIEVLEVKHQSVVVSIKLPQGKKIVELQCGNTVKVDYWDAS